MARIIKLFFLSLFVFLAAMASDSGVSGPLAGFLLDPETRTLRPALGVPGAAHAGPAILSDVEAASIAPRGDVALAATPDALVLVRRLPSGEFDATRIENGLAGANGLAWSADGAVAAAYSASARAAQIIRDGAVVRLIDLAALEDVTALAIDNTGENLLVGAVGGVYAAKASHVQLAASLPRVAAIAIHGQNAFIAADAIYELADFAGKAALLPFAVEAGAAGIQVSGNGKRLVVAAAQSVLVYDIASRSALARTDLEWAPTTLARFGAPATFLLKSGKAGSEPLYIVDVSADPAVFFVPVGREE
jgi:hypothetical protein